MLELIARYEINTQDELIELLRDNGFDVTQATVSRDIRELKIAKMTTGRGTYRYVLPKHIGENSAGIKFNNTLVDSVLSVEYACNIIVLKTYPGMANAVAVGIDSMNLHQVLGCVAGDDTIMIVSRDAECATVIADRIRMLMKNL
jgi:transcriptional regulator of arginine metabolism